METVKQINCKFETALAYYEMCVEDAMLEYFTEAESDTATKSIWAKIKEIVAKIFKTLGETLSKIGDKIKGKLNGQTINELVSECNKLYDSIEPYGINEMVEVKNINGLIVVSRDYILKVMKLVSRIKSRKTVEKDEVNELRESYIKAKNSVPATAKYTLNNLIDTQADAYKMLTEYRRRMDIDWANAIANYSSNDTRNADSIPAIASFQAELLRDMEAWKMAAVSNLITIRNKMKGMAKNELTVDTHSDIQIGRDVDDYLQGIKYRAQILRSVMR